MDQWKKNGNDKEINAPQFLSKFVVTCAFVWASIVKAIHRYDDEDEYFAQKQLPNPEASQVHDTQANNTLTN
ncbi:hypothetical protein MTR_2g104210 [Medicago truncatula]|uniref:Uncharacterized protein n=1 Tax=Medicago truncatula TaxID=3880 RepID=G7IIA2_MEDTR|nr:hypothetical protein MTR_2g104210 [Medicago truncatula]